MAQKVTAGHDRVGSFAPLFAELNDDFLFDKVWAKEEAFSPRERSIVTLSCLIASGVMGTSIRFHLAKVREKGLSKKELGELITHAACYVGVPKAWGAFDALEETWRR